MAATVSPFHTKASALAAKRDLLIIAARQYAHGVANLSDLEEAAVAFSDAIADKAEEGMRQQR